ncbi:unnamed protein product [Paramecium primaurelia]|uniref:Uncharacterized protein n=1 Tax=Paramecium primaurelia TaxID=5886 RepID=A0A8S1QL91_PARPR|nr:unnamed protein product [Paramecium primaurelia]
MKKLSQQKFQKLNFPNNYIKIFKELQDLLEILKKFQILIYEYNQKSENLITSLVYTEKLLLNMPHSLQNFELYQKQKSSKIVPARKVITQIGNKNQRINVSKNQKSFKNQSQQKPFFLDIYRNKVKRWKINDEISLDVTDILLNDVPKQFFTIDLDWEASQPWVENMRISSLKKEIEGFKLTYLHFQNLDNLDDLDILDLVFGSGYVSLLLFTLALKRKQMLQIQFHLVDHHHHAIKFLTEIKYRIFAFKQNVQHLILFT